MGKCNWRKYPSFVRIVREWNNLPGYVVEAGSYSLIIYLYLIISFCFLKMFIPFSLIQFLFLYYYMTNFCNLIGLEQWYFSLIWITYMWNYKPFAGSSINK